MAVKLVLRDIDVRDALQEHINATIDYYLGITYRKKYAPHLVKDAIHYDDDYFIEQKINPPQGYLSSEYKTIAHLAPFYRNRIIYNPKNIDRLMWAIGLSSRGESTFDIRCFETSNIGDCDNGIEDSFIDYESWKLLPENKPTKILETIGYNITTVYNDGIDMLPDLIGVK